MANQSDENNRYEQGATPEMEARAASLLKELQGVLQSGAKTVTIDPNTVLVGKDWDAALRLQLRAQLVRRIATSDDALRNRLATTSDFIPEVNRAAGVPADASPETASQMRAEFLRTLTREDFVDDIMSFTPGVKDPATGRTTRGTYGGKFSGATNAPVYKNIVAPITTALRVNFIRSVGQGEIDDQNRPGRKILSNKLALDATVAASSDLQGGFATSPTVAQYRDNLSPELQAKFDRNLADAGFTAEQLDNCYVNVGHYHFLQLQDAQTPDGHNVGPDLADSLSAQEKAELTTLVDALESNKEAAFLPNKKGVPSRSVTEQRVNSLLTGGRIDQGTMMTMRLANLYQNVVRSQARGKLFLDQRSASGIPSCSLSISKVRIRQLHTRSQVEVNQETARAARAKRVSGQTEGVLARLEKAKAASIERNTQQAQGV